MRTYRESAGEEAPEVAVAHIPIDQACLDRSLHSAGAVRPLDPGSLQSVALWRERHDRGEVGAFSVPLWKAERLAWTTASRHSPETTIIEYAFPKPNPAGEYSIVEVACAARN